MTTTAEDPLDLRNTIIPLLDHEETEVTVNAVPLSVPLPTPKYMLPVLVNAPSVAMSNTEMVEDWIPFHESVPVLVKMAPLAVALVIVPVLVI